MAGTGVDGEATKETPAPGAKWGEGCESGLRCRVEQGLAAARGVVDGAIKALSAYGSTAEPGTADLLETHFHTKTKEDAEAILEKLKAIRKELDASVKYICTHDKEACKAEKGFVHAWTTCSSGADVGLCNTFWLIGCEGRAPVMIHEMAHHVLEGCGDPAYIHQPEYKDLGPEEAKRNPDSYTHFALAAGGALNCPSCH